MQVDDEIWATMDEHDDCWIMFDVDDVEVWLMIVDDDWWVMTISDG